MMTIRFLINDGGAPFELSDIQTFRKVLDSLDDKEREEYRNQNASAIVKHGAIKILIVSGPGTGKSHLFLNRIDHWYQKDKNASVVVTSFVRKLVADLQNDIETDEKLPPEQKGKIMVSTLHKFARSIVEKNHGTTEWPFRPHFRIIGQSWKEIVWRDVLYFHPNLDRSVYTWKKFEEQLHDNNFEGSDEWKGLKETYNHHCQFYNAAGFADLILRATKALAENSNLNKDSYFIIDEYQDFNLAEEALIKQLVENPKGLLVVGDDEQVLYENLKSGKPTLIRNLYKNNCYANCMLPFCSRSSFQITKTADHFIQQHKEAECIEKIYLPLKTNSNDPKVQVIACATAPTAVDYIEKFVSDNKAEIDERRSQLEAGEAKDAFVLILTPAKEVNFYVNKKFNGRKKLEELVSEYQTETRLFSEDYYKLLSYYSLKNNPYNNFAFRKVLHYEGISGDKVHEFIVKAVQKCKNLCDLEFQEIKDTLSKCNDLKTILDGISPTAKKLEQVVNIISVTDKQKLQKDLEKKAISKKEMLRLEHEEEEDAELEEIEVKRLGAVELITIVGSKGLSADHVIIIGFDNVNMKLVTKNAFYVAITRARKSLHIITALKSGGARRSHDFLNQFPDNHVAFYSYKKSNRLKNQLNGKQGFMNYINTLYSVLRR